MVKSTQKSGSTKKKVWLLRFFLLGAMVFFVAGVALLAVNITGLFLSLRNPELRSEKTLFKNDITIGLSEAREAIERRPDEEREAYVRRLTRVISDAMAHGWSDSYIDKYHLRLPVWENYILYYMSFHAPGTYMKYEYADYRKALERGVGLCSQHTLVLTEVLREKGIQCYLLALDGHVVARAEIEKGRWIIADPDYGIVVPHDIRKVQASPEMVIPYYQGVKKMYRRPDKGYSPERIAEIYGFENNYFIRDAKGYLGAPRYNFERRAYLAKWLLPVLLMLPLILVVIIKHTYKRLFRIKRISELRHV